jgi:hypothetical protein
MLKEKYDLSGHFYGSDQEYLNQIITSAISSYKTIQYFSNKGEDTVLSKEDIEYYKKREKLGVQLDECSHCGNTVYLQNNSNIWTATESCPFPTGLPAYSVEIDVPSGNLIFANNLTKYFPTYDDYYINLICEMQRQTEGYAKEGLIHVSVGNSCPSVYKINKNKIVVGVNGPEEKWNEETEEWECLSDEEIIKTTLPGGYEGSICTDLWAFGAADLNNLISRIKYLDPNFQPIIGVNGLNIGTNFIVKVTPGRYRAMVTWHLITDTDSYPQIYTTIERIGDVLSKDPIPFKLGPEGIEEDFETSLKVNNLSYPELFPIRERILDHIFCVNGNGLDWAPNGTVPIMGRKAIQARKELKNGREVTIPNGYLEYYYPICEYSLIANVPDNIRPDWLKGVYETLDLLLKLDPEYKCFSGWKNTHNIEWAKKIKEELNKRFYDCTNK